MVPRNLSDITNYDDMTLSCIDFVMRFKRGGMALEAKEHLEEKLTEIQESLDVINYKLATYEQICGPITMEMVNQWKEKTVLFEMPTYEYLRTGEVIGACMKIRKEYR